MAKKLIVDCFGCDDPKEVIYGVAKAINGTKDVDIIAAGNEDIIVKTLNGVEFDRDRLSILDASDVVTNDDSPVDAILHKKNSSLYKSLRALKENDDIIGMISAGSTGAVLAGCSLILGRTVGVDRPSLAALLPNDKGGMTCLVDSGANVDCRPEQLVQFAYAGANYMKSVYSIEKPKVALLSVGTEDKKGNALSKATFKLLKESDLNFVGNMEARTVLKGDFDVVVTDGFAGNVLLKTIEGAANSIVMRAVNQLMRHLPKNVDPSFIKQSFEALQKEIDFNSLGGGVILGVKKIVVKSHGCSNSETIFNCAVQALKMYDGGFSKELV